MRSLNMRENNQGVGVMPFHKYKPYPKVELSDRTWPDQRIEKAPLWCSVDLRDGNQALVNPMDIKRKQLLYDYLVKMGFREIEIGFPSASQPDFDFCRKLIENGLIPEQVTIQVLTQARDDLIERTFQAIKGSPRAIVHFYNSTSVSQRKIVFKANKQKVTDMAVAAAVKCQQQLKKAKKEGWGDQIRFEYSPESYTGTEPEYAQSICQAVAEVLQPTVEKPLIINLPATVEMSSANIYGDLIERFHRNLKNRDRIVLSIHPHNDRGTAVAAAEFGIMAGAERVEGTLFGNGERTGNVDLITIALNLFSQGVDPELDITDIDQAKQIFEYANQMTIAKRHPYVGDFVYTAFSGSHQDAIKKGMAHLYGVKPGQPLTGDYDVWNVPYLPIDPKHVGRDYDAIVRVNSQSGKGGIAYILFHQYGWDLPRDLQIDFYKRVQSINEATGNEMNSYEVYQNFLEAYNCSTNDPVKVVDSNLKDGQTMQIDLDLLIGQTFHRIAGNGRNPAEATLSALANNQLFKGELVNYWQHTTSSRDKQISAYVVIDSNNERLWGISRGQTINQALIKATINAAVRSGLIKIDNSLYKQPSISSCPVET